MTSTLEAARHYLDMGWSVLPLWGVMDGVCGCGHTDCTSPGKHPALQEWTTYFGRQPQQEEIDSWFSTGNKNIGIVCGEVSDNLMVIDCDDPKTYCALCYVYPELSESLTDKTGNGYHIYVYAEQKVATTSWWLNGKKHHIKADRSMVVAPPSNHYSGRVYQFVEPDAPPFLVDLRRLKAALFTQKADTRKPVADEGSHERGRAAQIFRDGARLGERDEMTFYLANSLRHGYGVPWDFAEAILSLWAEQRCDQPWGEVDVRAKLRAVARYSHASTDQDA